MSYDTLFREIIMEYTLKNFLNILPLEDGFLFLLDFLLTSSPLPFKLTKLRSLHKLQT